MKTCDFCLGFEGLLHTSILWLALSYTNKIMPIIAVIYFTYPKWELYRFSPRLSIGLDLCWFEFFFSEIELICSVSKSGTNCPNDTLLCVVILFIEGVDFNGLVVFCVVSMFLSISTLLICQRFWFWESCSICGSLFSVVIQIISF